MNSRVYKLSRKIGQVFFEVMVGNIYDNVTTTPYNTPPGYFWHDTAVFFSLISYSCHIWLRLTVFYIKCGYILYMGSYADIYDSRHIIQNLHHPTSEIFFSHEAGLEYRCHWYLCVVLPLFIQNCLC